MKRTLNVPYDHEEQVYATHGFRLEAVKGFPKSWVKQSLIPTDRNNRSKQLVT